jgi:hypothetical protein
MEYPHQSLYVHGDLHMIDWTVLQRLLPEVSILIVVGYFSLKCLTIFRSILTDIDERNGKNYKKLITAINHNTKATQSADIYLRERNGRDSEIHKELIKEMKAIPIAMNLVADRNLKKYQETLEKTVSQRKNNGL